MNKVFIFGKPGGGKSVLSKKLSARIGISSHALDLIQYHPSGELISSDAFNERHADLIGLDKWIIEGFGTIDSFWLTVDAADTLIYLDLHYSIHYWWVTKRLLKSFVVKPEGWPQGSSVLKGTLTSWKHLRLSPWFWNHEFLENVMTRGADKDIYRFTSVEHIDAFLNQLDYAD